MRRSMYRFVETFGPWYWGLSSLDEVGTTEGIRELDPVIPELKGKNKEIMRIYILNICSFISISNLKPFLMTQKCETHRLMQKAKIY